MSNAALTEWIKNADLAVGDEIAEQHGRHGYTFASVVRIERRLGEDDTLRIEAWCEDNDYPTRLIAETSDGRTPMSRVRHPRNVAPRADITDNPVALGRLLADLSCIHLV